MIAVFIFYLHIVGVTYAFAQGYHNHKLVDGFLAVAFVAIIFSVGWTISGFIVHFFIPAEGFGEILDPDSISLLIVTGLEAVLYITYFFRRSKNADSEVAV
ncbi:MAG: hypothetical protein CL946_09895 [Ectothiorhodospiraceae bacterium]|nr:hypothetical protein [Ectothiorhodospiraceae bacterium]